MTEKIDFVVTWVDGNDENWRKVKEQYSSKKTEDNSNVRFRDWDTLKYWFRGVEKYAPWVNKIHFVTWGHVPSWLNINHPKLSIVKHEDFIPNEYLPTFNSHVIELNFHRIQGLSERFVYFNDDMFLLNKVDSKDFFKSGLPCDSFVLGVTNPIQDTYYSTLFNNMALINKHFDKQRFIKQNPLKVFNLKYGKGLIKNLLLLPWPYYTGFHDPHIATPYLKSSFIKLWEMENETLSETCKYRFRNNNNVNHFIFRYFQLATGHFVPSKILGENLPLGKKNDWIYDAIQQRKYKIVCLNDTEMINNFEREKSKLLSVFNKILPVESTFENK